MGIYDRGYVQDRHRSEDSTVVSFANRVYWWMTMGLLTTAFIAYSLYATGMYVSLMPYWWIFGFGTIGIAFAIGGMGPTASFGTLGGLFFAYAGLEGLFFGVTLPMYAAAYGGQVIWLAFTTAAMVSTLAIVYGVTTRSDLTNMGRLLNFALMGLMAMTLLYFVMSFFMTLTWFHLLLSYLGLGIFVGLTAYDAQQIRQLSYQAGGNSAAANKLSLLMALKMYINVIMIFWYLLQIFSRRD
jgi:FtsH-binding integral membrane protein